MEKTVGDRLSAILKEKNMTSRELADKAGVSPTWVSYLINGKRDLSDEVKGKLAEALEVDWGLITGEAVSCIINEQIEKIGMTLEEVAEKARVSFEWLKNLDSFIPGEHDIKTSGELDWDAVMGDYESYEWISRVAIVIGLPPSLLRTALARQETPLYDGPWSTPEEDFFCDSRLAYLETVEGVISAAESFSEEYKTSNISPVDLPPGTLRIPVLGSIPAGIAIEAVEDIVGWEEIPEDWLNGDREYFGLLVRGDSMYPEYLDGDTVIIRKQNCCDSGDDCAVILDGKNATLKKVRIFEDGIELEAINKMYGKKKFTNKEVETLPVTILGVVVELRRKKK